MPDPDSDDDGDDLAGVFDDDELEDDELEDLDDVDDDFPNGDSR